MTSAGTFSLSAIARALGVKGGVRPAMDTRAIYPVAIYSDFSRTLSAEAIEPRAVLGATLDPAIPGASVYELHSRASGGTVVENLVLETEIDFLTWPGSSGFWFIYRGATPFLAFHNNEMVKMDIGGPPTQVVAWAEMPAYAGIDFDLLPYSYHMRTDMIGLRIYVPAGWWFAVIFGRAGTHTICSMHVREIVDALGPP